MFDDYNDHPGQAESAPLQYPWKDEAGFALACSALVNRIAAVLLEKGLHAAAAESLTGGLISSEIVRVAGSSRWFAEGCVTYTDAAKAARLGVDKTVLAENTAVSMPVAMQMAEGMMRTSGTDIAVSATGLAGPGADEFGREAGLVFIGGANKHGSVGRRLSLSGDRLTIRQRAAYCALRLLLSLAEAE